MQENPALVAHKIEQDKLNQELQREQQRMKMEEDKLDAEHRRSLIGAQTEQETARNEWHAKSAVALDTIFELLKQQQQNKKDYE